MIGEIKKPAIAFIYRSFSSFVKRDFNILKKYFDITSTKWNGKRSILNILKGILKSDLSFSWFASDYAAVSVFFSKMFGKKSIIVVGGFDAAFVPEIGYGQFTLGWRKRMMTKYAVKNADIVLPVSKFTKEEMLKKVKPKEFKLIYNGVNINKFFPKGEKEENLVIKISGVSRGNLKRKGIETFVNSAKLLPNVRFVVIGKFIDDSIEYLKSIASSNVEFTGFVSDEDLIGWFQKAKVICQLSYYEAFGLTPAEGMACGCIPVVTEKRNGMNEFVRDVGFYVSYGDEKETAEAIKKALSSSGEDREKAREIIKKSFSLQKREKELKEVVEKWINKK